MLSIIIPYGRPDPTRDRLLEHIRSDLSRRFPSAEIIISRDTGVPWCKSRAINRGVARAHGDQLLLCDADVLVGGLEEMVHRGRAVPYAFVRNLSAAATERILEGGEPSEELSIDRIRQKAGSGRGGAIAIDRELFESVGGFDERFVGWGGEDVAFVLSVGKLAEVPCKIYHLWHEPPKRVLDFGNKDLLRKYERGKVTNRYTPVDFFTWAPHYTEHLLPVWLALPEKARGTFYHTDDTRIPGGRKCATPGDVVSLLGEGERPVVLSSLAGPFINAIRRPLVRAHHGAGQFYRGANHRDRDGVVLDLVPNESTKAFILELDPSANVAVVGCPKLDQWTGYTKDRDDPPTVGISFHFDLKVVPETRSAWPHFKSALPELAVRFNVLGHGHPRIIDELAPYYRDCGIEIVRSHSEILRRSDVFCMDHMSSLYEFAYTDRPVVVLNAPWYRRDVEHGLRYWEYSNVGVNCDHPGEWIAAIEKALEDPSEQRELRRRAVEAVYAVRGVAARAAAQEIVSLGASDYNKTPGGCMRLEVTNPTFATVCRGGMLFRGQTTTEVVVGSRYKASEIKGCTSLRVKVLGDRMNDRKAEPDYQELTNKELREIAREKGIPQVYKLRTKAALIEAIK